MTFDKITILDICTEILKGPTMLPKNVLIATSTNQNETIIAYNRSGSSSKTEINMVRRKESEDLQSKIELH